MGFINKVQLLDGNVEVCSPFTLESDGRRKYIRLELAEPVTIQQIKQPGDSFAPEGSSDIHEGGILNLSSGGALLETSELVAAGSLVALSFTLQGDVRLSDVLAIVRRVDIIDGQGVMGVSFVGRDQLMDVLSGAELELLDKRFNRFEMQAESALAQYVTKKDIAKKDIAKKDVPKHVS